MGLWGPNKLTIVSWGHWANIGPMGPRRPSGDGPTYSKLKERAGGRRDHPTSMHRKKHIGQNKNSFLAYLPVPRPRNRYKHVRPAILSNLEQELRENCRMRDCMAPGICLVRYTCISICCIVCIISHKHDGHIISCHSFGTPCFQATTNSTRQTTNNKQQ